MFLFVVFIIVFAFLYAIYLLKGSGDLNNHFIFISSWFLAMMLYCTDLLGVFPKISLEVSFYLMQFFTLYGLSYLFFYWVQERVIRPSNSHSVAWQGAKIDYRKIFIFAWFFLFVYFIQQLNTSEGFLKIMFSQKARTLLRTANVSITYYIFGYLYLLAVFYMSFVSKKQIGRFESLLIILVLLSLALTAAKMNVFTAGFIIYFCWAFNNRRPLRKTIFDFLISIFIMYFFITIFSIYTGKVIDLDYGQIKSLSDISELSTNALMYPYNYFVGSLAAFDKFFTSASFLGHTGYENFNYTMSTFYKVLNTIIGFEFFKIPVHNKEFTWVGNIHTNVYTMHYSLVSDFGPYFAVSFAAILGFINSFFDIRMRYRLVHSFFFYASNFQLIIASMLSVINFKYIDTAIIFCLGLYILEATTKVLFRWRND